MWIETRDCEPLNDGYYLVQTVFGGITGLNYTLKGGWNTRYYKGKLLTESAIESTYVARWYDAEKPKAVPEEWVNEHLRKGVNKCATE